MFDVAVSEITSARWDLQHEIARVAEYGFESLSLWRPKVSDLGTATTARLLGAAGIRVSSLQWAGGFTGGDGRSFAESVDDAVEAIAAAAELSAPVLVIHSGCRGGHTRSHALRLLTQAIETVAPLASRSGVSLAVRPVAPQAAPGCSFLAGLAETLDLVEGFSDPSVRLSLDLWHFGHDDQFAHLLPRLAAAAAVVQVADRCGPPSPAADRLPAGYGSLPLERLVGDLVGHGYHGAVEFDPVGEAVEVLGYEGVWQETRLVAESWSDRLAARRYGPLPSGINADRGSRRGQFRAASAAGVRRSHASSHSGSPG